jgi:hypothetical protein
MGIRYSVQFGLLIRAVCVLPLQKGGSCSLDRSAEGRPVALQSGSDEYAGIAAAGDNACDFSVGV